MQRGAVATGAQGPGRSLRRKSDEVSMAGSDAQAEEIHRIKEDLQETKATMSKVLDLLQRSTEPQTPGVSSTAAPPPAAQKA